MAAIQRGYTAGRFLVQLGGKPVGFADSVEGGDAYSDVVEEKIGADGVIHKHLAGVNYGDLTLAVGANMSPPFYDWIASTLEHKHERKDGTVSFQDYTGAEKEQLTWQNGLITEIGFPEVDAASKDAGRLTVKIAPESTRHAKGSGTKGNGKVNSMQKKWLVSNFRLSIDGIDCTRVQKVGALTVVQTVTADPVGEKREPSAHPAVLHIPNLVVTLAEARADDFIAWHEDFVMRGNNDASHEKTGTLEFLTANAQDALFTLELSGLGIFRLTRLKSESGTSGVSSVEAQIYCEELKFSYPKAAASGVGAAASGNGAAANASDPAVVLASALTQFLGTRLDPSTGAQPVELVAARLRASTNGDPASPDNPRSVDRGRKLGATWARERAALPELEQVAETRDGDWNVLALPEGSSLLAYLQEAAVAPAAHDGPLTLERDPFVEALVDGAAGVYEEVRPHLEEAPA
jgi:hypothetical protein